MARKSSNFQLREIFEALQTPERPLKINEFGNFIYKDHVTRIKYNVENLKSKKKQSTNFQGQTVQPFLKTHKQTKSMDSMVGNKSRFQSGHMDEIEFKKNELINFLEHLEIKKNIRKNRNFIISGADKAEKRKSIFPSMFPSQMMAGIKTQNIDILKQQIRKQVNELSTELFREYMENSEPYRAVFNELNTVSSKGALNSGKIKQIKEKIEECTKRKHIGLRNIMIRKRELNSKENDKYEQYFSSAAKQIDQEIRLRVKHQATFNWKYGKRQTIEDMLNSYIANTERNSIA